MDFSLYTHCVLLAYNEEVRKQCPAFSCRNTELDKFFEKDAENYAVEMLGKSYCWVTDDEQKQIVAIFTVSNDSIKTKDLLSSSKNKLQRHINNLKRGRSYPAVLIGRFAVNKLFQGNGYKIGSQTMNFIKSWLIEPDDKTACRFLVVDAYNKESVLSFYLSNNFLPLFKTEEEEKAFYHISTEEQLHTRLLYFDLKIR